MDCQKTTSGTCQGASQHPGSVPRVFLRSTLLVPLLQLQYFPCCQSTNMSDWGNRSKRSSLSNCRLKYETEQLKTWGSKGMKALDWHKVQRSNVKAKMKTHLPHLYCGKHFPIKHSLMLYNFWCNISLLPRYSLYMGNIKVKNVIFNVQLQPCDI